MWYLQEYTMLRFEWYTLFIFVLYYTLVVNTMIKKEKCCPPSIAYANSADAPYIPSPKGRGFTAHFDNKNIGSISAPDGHQR